MMKVIQTIQSTNGFDAPADVVWYTGEDRLAAVVALAQAAADSGNQFFTIQSVRIDFS